MRAVFIREPGGPDVLELREVPDPEIPYGHVRVRLSFAGVNRADLMQRAGFYPAPPGVPPNIPGLEYSGVVDAVGAGTTRFSPGDRVFGLVAGGAYAEKVIAHEREVVKVPAGLSDLEAAAVPEAFVTAYDALMVRGRLQPGERVLVHAAGSGVGTAAVQVARAVGCFVIGTSRTTDKLDRCRELGLNAGVVPTTTQEAFHDGAASGPKPRPPAEALHDGAASGPQPRPAAEASGHDARPNRPRAGGHAAPARVTFAGPVFAVTGGRGADVVIDLVGGDYTRESVAACATLGRVVLVGLTGGASTELPLGDLLRKRITLVGTMLRARPLEEKIAAAQILETSVGAWLAEKRVRGIVDRVFPLTEAGAAHAFVASNAGFGKVLLEVG